MIPDNCDSSFAATPSAPSLGTTSIPAVTSTLTGQLIGGENCWQTPATGNADNTLTVTWVQADALNSGMAYSIKTGSGTGTGVAVTPSGAGTTASPYQASVFQASASGSIQLTVYACRTRPGCPDWGCAALMAPPLKDDAGSKQVRTPLAMVADRTFWESLRPLVLINALNRGLSSHEHAGMSSLQRRGKS